ncbi:armadillo repeat-containing protein 3 isoform X2 [Periplaneta americana]|uniref:armadillo repeat-containing protein 3 isoform X2 n=1 Tax=Periplaneta americana TaxID=6978 RepID=UPI0037E85FAA
MAAKQKKRENRSQTTKIDFDPISIESRTAETAVLMLRSTEEPVVLQESDTKMQEFCAGILAELTREHYACVKMMQSPVVGLLLTRITSVDPDIQKNSLQIISNILQDPVCAESFSQSEDFEFRPILALLLSEYPVIQHLVMQVIFTVACRRQEEFCKAGGVENLVDVLEVLEWKDVHHMILAVLNKCSEADQFVRYLCSSGSVNRLCSYMAEILDPELSGAALAVVVKISRLQEGCEILHEVRMEEQLCALLREEEHAGFQGAACQGLRLMAVYKECRDVIVEENPVRDIVSIIKNEAQPMETRLIASQALSELLKLDKRFCQAVLERKRQECLECLLQLPLGKIPLEMAVSLVTSLKHMSSHESIRAKMLESSLVESLLCCFQDCGVGCMQLKVQSCYALANIICEEAVKDRFLAQGGVAHIVQCLQSSSLVLLQAAATLVQAAAGDHKLAKAMMYAGALERMLKAEHLRTRFKCPVWETAIEALFKSNLSMKFAYIGRLEQNDITDDGFYIMRRVERPFPILEQLLINRVSPIRPIYVVNFKAVASEPPATVAPSSSSFTGKKSRSNKKRENASAEHSSFHSMQLDDYEALLATAYGRCVPDPYLPCYLEQLQTKLDQADLFAQCGQAETKTLQTMICVLANFVCEQMCGPDSMGKWHDHVQELHLNELKLDLGTNVIPLGYVRVGQHLERAMLFKVLADCVGLPCALVRGEGQHAWIEVAVPETDSEEEAQVSSLAPAKSDSFCTTPSGHMLHTMGTQTCPQPEPEPEPEPEFIVQPHKSLNIPNRMIRPNAIVDLMDMIGKLYPIGSYNALKYCGKLQ